ncbi:MAG: hemolysin III family protein [Clostridiales bacterium]|nr:hemolysin III family protein [Clostridiales bacterium]
MTQNALSAAGEATEAAEPNKPMKPEKKWSLPTYTRGEELFSMITHIVGGGLGLVAMIACVIVAAFHHNVWGVVSGCIYGFCVILLFTMSSIYHGLRVELPKRVFQIIDHCTIFVLIAGTYTPIVLSQFRRIYPGDAWVMFSVIWALAVTGIVLNSIDLKRFKTFSLVCYLGMGWMAVFKIDRLVEVLGAPFFIMILTGGILYSIGVVFYVWGKKKRFMHSVFHLFVNAASILHSVAIIVFVMP